MSGNKYFLFLKDGVFTERCVSPKSFSSIPGHLVNITFKHSPHGKIMKLHLVDEENFYMVSLFVNSRPVYALLMMLGGVDFNDPILLMAKSDNGRDLLSIWQNDASVRWTVDAPGFGLLPIHEKVDMLLGITETKFIPALQKKVNPYPVHPFYKPMRKSGLQGGYFDAHKADCRIPGPVSSAEQNTQYHATR